MLLNTAPAPEATEARAETVSDLAMPGRVRPKGLRSVAERSFSKHLSSLWRWLLYYRVRPTTDFSICHT